MYARPAIQFCVPAVFLLLAGCEEDIKLPPEDRPTVVADGEVPDLKHSAAIRADREFSIPNMTFVVQSDPRAPDELALTLISRRPGHDGSRMVLAAFEKASKIENLVEKDLVIAGRPFFDPTGMGVFTVTTAYQPKLVTLRLDSVQLTQVSGRITGDFYVFNVTRPKLKPDVRKLEAAFSAAIVQK